MKVTGLDILSPFYRPLADVFFFRDFRLCYQSIANEPLKGSVLIIGCGNSTLLSFLDLSAIKEIDLLDISDGMLQQTRKHPSYEVQKMNCIHADFETFHFSKKYDFIIMPFYLDVVPKSKQANQLSRALKALNGHGELLIADFLPSKSKWHNLKIGISRALFSLLTCSSIPSVRHCQDTIERFYPKCIKNISPGRKSCLWRIKPPATIKK